MRVGLLLDNCAIGEVPAQGSYEKLEAMGATAVGLLWTGGTRHGRLVYEECERRLELPFYIVRVGGHRQSSSEWWDWARAALAEAPKGVLLEGRLALACGNEPNLEGWGEWPEEYGRLYATTRGASVPVLFACPSVGVAGWWEWLDRAVAAAGAMERAIVNVYAGNVGRVAELRRRFGEVYVGEVNSEAGVRGAARRSVLEQTFGWLAGQGCRAALVFIAGGRSGGAWDERYIVTAEEVAGLGAAAAQAAAPGAKGVGMGTYRIGNLEVDDLRAAMPDEPGKMLPVTYTVKDFISVHHTATSRSATPKAIYDYHKSLGWGGIGYNFLIGSDGYICYVGECNTERAGVGQIGEGNSRGIHVAFIDDLTERAPSLAALAAARLLIANIQHAYGWWLPVVPHRLFNTGASRWDTECPGGKWREWWHLLLRRVGE